MICSLIDKQFIFAIGVMFQQLPDKMHLIDGRLEGSFDHRTGYNVIPVKRFYAQEGAPRYPGLP